MTETKITGKELLERIKMLEGIVANFAFIDFSKIDIDIDRAFKKAAIIFGVVEYKKKYHPLGDTDKLIITD